MKGHITTARWHVRSSCVQDLAQTADPSTLREASGCVFWWQRKVPMCQHMIRLSAVILQKAQKISSGPLNIFFFFLSGKFAVPYLLEYNSPQNIKQIHSVLCRHIITLCVHVMHICSPLAVHLVNVWETPRFKASSVSFVL